MTAITTAAIVPPEVLESSDSDPWNIDCWDVDVDPIVGVLVEEGDDWDWVGLNGDDKVEE